jgi:hypothetical protein
MQAVLPLREQDGLPNSCAAPHAQDLKLGPWLSEAAPAAGGAAGGGGDEGAYDLFALAAHQHDPKLAYPSDDRQGRLVRPASRHSPAACALGRTGTAGLVPSKDLRQKSSRGRSHAYRPVAGGRRGARRLEALLVPLRVAACLGETGEGRQAEVRAPSRHVPA